MASRDAILDAWSRVIGRDGWSLARIDAVARAAGCNASEVAAQAGDRWEALRGLDSRFEQVALAEAASDPDESVRNRLFALFMARFDALQDQRDLARQLRSAARTDPALAVFVMTLLPPMLRRLAEAAGVDAGGLFGPVRIAALSVLYVQIVRVWLTDDSADLSATMKALDGALARAERAANFPPDFATDRLAIPGSAGGRLPE